LRESREGSRLGASSWGKGETWSQGARELVLRVNSMVIVHGVVLLFAWGESSKRGRGRGGQGERRVFGLGNPMKRME